MKKSGDTVTIKAQATVRKDVWETIIKYWGYRGQTSKIFKEALRRWFIDLQRTPDEAPSYYYNTFTQLSPEMRKMILKNMASLDYILRQKEVEKSKGTIWTDWPGRN